MSTIDLTAAILAINSSAAFEEGGDVDNITWYGGTTPIAKADILAKQTELQAVEDGNAYQQTRADAYPELKEQFDLLYHDMAADNGDKTGTWFAAVKAVKDANPKP